MIAVRARLVALMVATAAAAAPMPASGQSVADDPIATNDPVARGQYVFDAAGCAGCHTDVAAKGPLLAGGRPLKTSFGTFYSPNITPDIDTGIGAWSEADFMRALRDGRAPDGGHYFPAFPYPSYTGMSARDMRDLKAYIFSLPAITRENRPHDVGPPFGWRFLLGIWKWLYFTPGPRQSDPERGRDWNRGAYLVQVLGHCAECHTPRDLIGGRQADMAFAGTDSGPEGGSIPNITPDPETGLGRWSVADFQSLLEMGMKPDGDFVDSEMAEVVENSTGKLAPNDRDAIITYLRSLAAIRHHVTVNTQN